MIDRKAEKCAGEAGRESVRRLVESLRAMISEAEETVVQTASDQMDEAVEHLRVRVQKRLDDFKENYQQAEDRVADMASAVDRTIREKPYQSLGIAAGIGVLVGFWLSRKC